MNANDRANVDHLDLVNRQQSDIICGFSEHDAEAGYICPLLNPNEEISSCLDCCFAIIRYDT